MKSKWQERHIPQGSRGQIPRQKVSRKKATFTLTFIGPVSEGLGIKLKKDRLAREKRVLIYACNVNLYMQC